MGAPAPTFIPEPFANQQIATYITFPIPDAPPASPANSACWKLGFQSITMQPEIGGGLPPFGQDFNGILYTVTTHTYALQAGQFYIWDPSFVTSISGYSKGATLAMEDGAGWWMSIANANTTDPDDDPTAANWVPAFCYGISAVNGLTGGTVVATPSQARRGIISLNGALTSNLTFELPAQVQVWFIINNTTGAFTTTVKTPAGTGVVVPQGGPSQPTQVYGDGSNIYDAQSPLSTPISIAATPLTVLERDNTGQGFLTRLNQSSAWNENPAFLTGSVYVQNNAQDGYGRWASVVYFLQQIFANAALTGNPTAPTQPLSDTSTKIATTAFVKSQLAGLTFRTGTFNIVSNAGGFVSFSTPFPTNCLGVVASVPLGGFQPGCTGFTPSGFTLSGNACGTQLATYLAWGN